jgi:uncharacterized SAM-binding protein YcdF (DUF218 family)
MPRRRYIHWARVPQALLLLVFVAWLASLIGVLLWEHRDEARPAGAIVVLGAAQYVGRPSPVLRARLDHALQLWQRGLAPRMVLTGGRGDGDTTSEAAVGRRYVMRRGVPDSAILLETRGRTTSESLQEVAIIMDDQPSRTVILVSDPFHMLRLAILTRRFGMTPLTSPTRTSPISASPGKSLRYVIGESVKVPFAFFLERRPK